MLANMLKIPVADTLVGIHMDVPGVDVVQIVCGHLTVLITQLPFAA